MDECAECGFVLIDLAPCPCCGAELCDPCLDLHATVSEWGDDLDEECFMTDDNPTLSEQIACQREEAMVADEFRNPGEGMQSAILASLERLKAMEEAAQTTMFDDLEEPRRGDVIDGYKSGFWDGYAKRDDMDMPND